jgi:hypothetical protein
MKRERKKYEDDDGRTIAKMNVDGMPWYASGAGKPSPGRKVPDLRKS